jgi:hypothetical protein
MSDITDRARELALQIAEIYRTDSNGDTQAEDPIGDAKALIAAALQRERDEEERAEPSPGYFEMYANEKARAERAEGEAKALRAALFRLTASISAHLADALPISCPTCIDALTKARAVLQSQGE